MKFTPKDDVRAAERITRLVARFAERFDPLSRIEFYGSMAARLTRLCEAESAFIGANGPSPLNRPFLVRRKPDSFLN